MAIITISRGTMSCGQKLAEMLADKLGYQRISREIIIKAADEYGVPERKLFEAIQKSPTLFQKLTFERERYLAYIQACLCEYAIDDNLIYHGNAGHFLLKGISHVLRIRIVANMSYRVKATVEQYKFTEKEAIAYIKKVDKERLKWTKFLYGEDWRSPKLYDIVFNLDNFNLNFVYEMVQHAVKQPQCQATDESKKAMRDLLITSRVKAAIARISNIRLETLDIQADDGAIVIRGRAKSLEQLDIIKETVASVQGVKNVENLVEVDYRSCELE